MQLGDEEVQDDVEMNMTPMIDVTFQLIIFFMLVMDLSSRELEPVVMTKAKNAQKEEKVESYTVTVNIAHDKDVKCDDYSMNPNQPGFHKICRTGEHWKFYVKGKAHTPRSLREKLSSAASAKMGKDNKYSKVPVIIRADARAPWKYVREVMQICSQKDVRIYRVKLAAKIPRK